MYTLTIELQISRLFWRCNRIRAKSCNITSKSVFSHRIFELKLPKYQILKLAQSKGYNPILQILMLILSQCPYKQVIVGIGVSQGYFRALPKYLQKALNNGYPAYRVLDSQGGLTPHITNQRERLEAEGVRFVDRSSLVRSSNESFVELEDYMWNDPTIYST